MAEVASDISDDPYLESSVLLSFLKTWSLPGVSSFPELEKNESFSEDGLCWSLFFFRKSPGRISMDSAVSPTNRFVAIDRDERVSGYESRWTSEK